MRYPFEVSYEELVADLDTYVDAVFSCLESEFLVMPRGQGFIDYPVFEHGYEALKRATGGFNALNPDAVYTAALETPMIFIVLRSMLGFTPSEWAYVATERTGVEVTQGFARGLDRKIRLAPQAPIKRDHERLTAMVRVACQMLIESSPEVDEERLHRLDKADTREGLASIRRLAGMGVPYAMLLYERFLGRPFAGHRDSVSELIGDSLEVAIERILASAGVSFRKTKRAEKIPGFDQTPDFIIPSEFNPRVVIEAKITEDDGTARDKITRVQHLAELSMAGGGEPRFEVVACIAGRGFGQRREDMKKLLLATRGKIFTMRTLDRLVKVTEVKEFVSE
ncbi:MAG: hypothetical protein ACM3ZC_12755 [Bacteroidota bacterium]